MAAGYRVSISVAGTINIMLAQVYWRWLLLVQFKWLLIDFNKNLMFVICNADGVVIHLSD